MIVPSIAKLFSALRERTAVPADLPNGRETVNEMLRSTNQRQFLGVNVISFFFVLYSIGSSLFSSSGWTTEQRNAFLLFDSILSSFIVFSFFLSWLLRKNRISGNFMYWYRLVFLALAASWAAGVSVYESLTIQGIYTYMIVILIISLAFFHRLREMLPILAAGQFVFIWMLSALSGDSVNADMLTDISWGGVVGGLLISRIPYLARRQGMIYELSMRKTFSEREQADKAKTDFLRNISHELRTPLTGILGFSEAILHHTSEDATAKYSRLIYSEGEKLLILINRLLDISKIEAGKFELHPKIFDLGHALHVFIESYSERARLKGIAFRFEIDESVPDSLIGDEEQLIQVLTNLTGNAIKFTKHGMIKLVVRVLDARGESVRILFEITDTGVGIASDKQHDIFNAFSQEDASISREFGGTGLGTTLSQKIVQLMGGTIELESEKGKGSRFWFSLDFPVPRNTEKVHAASRQSVSSVFQGKHILLVEDYAINQKIARMYLEDMGCTVTLVENGLECLRLLKHKSFDLVLLDVQMPVLDGVETIKRIRGTKNLKELLVVGMTANAFEEDQQKYIQSGMNAVILKPFRRSELQEKLGAILEQESGKVEKEMES